MFLKGLIITLNFYSFIPSNLLILQAELSTNSDYLGKYNVGDMFDIKKGSLQSGTDTEKL